MTPADGGAAFPCSPGDVPFWNEGMSLRDWFAGTATEIAIDEYRIYDGMHRTNTNEQARYAYADAMLAARQERDQ